MLPLGVFVSLIALFSIQTRVVQAEWHPSPACVDCPLVIVTGGSRGLGKAMAERLHARGYKVCASTRNASAVSLVPSHFFFAYLELSNLDSIDSFVSHCLWGTSSGSVAGLVNNAAIFLDGWNEKVFHHTMSVNLFGQIALTKAVLPFMTHKGGRGGVGGTSPGYPLKIVNMSSSLGRLSRIKHAQYVSLFSPERDTLWARNPLDLALWKSHVLFDPFAGDLKTQTYYPAYAVSKAGLNCFTRALARYLSQKRQPCISVLACTPGWVRTDMGGPNAVLSVEEGIDTPLWLLSSPEATSGTFYRLRKEASWH